MSKEFRRELRRLALAGNRQKLGEVLKRQLEKEPTDALALEEIQRLEQGEELISSLETRAYNEGLRCVYLTALRDFIKLNPETELGNLKTKQLRALLRRFRTLQYRTGLNADNDPFSLIRAYEQILLQILKRRYHRFAWRVVLILAGMALLVLASWGAYSWCSSHAKKAQEELDNAVNAADWQRVLVLRETTDSGINRLLNPEYKDSLERTNVWIARVRAAYKDAAAILRPLQEGRRRVSSMTLAERAHMERTLGILPSALGDLSPIWEELCRQDHLALEEQRRKAIDTLHAELPPLPTLQGQPDKDKPLLDSAMEEEQDRMGEHRDIVDSYHLDESELLPVARRLAKLQEWQNRIESLRRTLIQLEGTHSYTEYTEAISSIPHNEENEPYATEQLLNECRAALPAEDEVQVYLSKEAVKLPGRLLEPALNIFLKKGPSFTNDSPVTPEQLELLDDLFSTSLLRQKLYEMRNAEGETAYAEAPGSEFGDLWRFKRSSSDPAYRINRPPEVSWLKKGVSYLIIDPTPLVESGRFERSRFFLHANLAQTLSDILHIDKATCPALAKAYVFNALLRVLDLHQPQVLTGLRFSPSLKADRASFYSLRDQIGLDLQAGCWLGGSAKQREAEKAYRKWFNEHAGRDYAGEIARRYAAVALVQPAYAGFITQEGCLHLCNKLPKDGVKLVYLTRNGFMSLAPDAAPPEEVIPFSPVFTERRSPAPKKERRGGPR